VFKSYGTYFEIGNKKENKKNNFLSYIESQYIHNRNECCMEKRLDKVIIQELQSLDEKTVDSALTYLYKVSKKTVSRFILRNKGGKQDVDDIFHDGLIAFYNLVRQNKINDETNVEAYLYSICRNMWAKKLKKRKTNVPLSETYDVVDTEDIQIDNILNGEHKSLIAQILKSLGEECEKILLLFYFEQLKTKEIVKHMHYANDQVLRNKKSKCMKKLRELVLESSYYKNQLK